MSDVPATAILGGTFNPIHFGHLRSALELADTLELSDLRLVPARVPPHRDVPSVAAADRASMVELAIAGEPRFSCDRRELERDGPSYTVDTLQAIRAELGAAHPLMLVMGCDAVLGLADWHRWRDLPALAHLIILARPGWSMPGAGPVAEFIRDTHISADALKTRAAGGTTTLELRPQDISSTAIRALLQSGRSARYLLPDSVLDYIHERGLYAEPPQGQ